MPSIDPPTFSEFHALPLATQEAVNRRWLAQEIARSAEAEARYLSGDLDRLASYRRFEIGE